MLNVMKKKINKNDKMKINPLKRKFTPRVTNTVPVELLAMATMQKCTENKTQTNKRTK